MGILIDNKLKFRDHIQKLNKKLACGCYALRVVTKELGVKMGRTVYFSLIESHLRYGIAFWGYCNQELMNSILVAQKRALRFLCGAGCREHCRPLFIKQGILTVICIFILETVCLLHKKYKYYQNSAQYNTRQNSNIPLPIPRSALTKKSLIFDSIKIYNHIPMAFRQVSNDRIFKKSVKKLLLSRPYYHVQEFLNESF